MTNISFRRPVIELVAVLSLAALKRYITSYSCLSVGCFRFLSSYQFNSTLLAYLVSSFEKNESDAYQIFVFSRLLFVLRLLIFLEELAFIPST